MVPQVPCAKLTRIGLALGGCGDAHGVTAPVGNGDTTVVGVPLSMPILASTVTLLGVVQPIRAMAAVDKIKILICMSISVSFLSSSTVATDYPIDSQRYPFVYILRHALLRWLRC